MGSRSLIIWFKIIHHKKMIPILSNFYIEAKTVAAQQIKKDLRK